MVLTPSEMMPLGTKAPDFSLMDTLSGKTMSLADFKGKRGFLLMFICNHCPYVKHVNDELVRLGKDYGEEISIAAVSSNDVESHPEDHPDLMRSTAIELRYPFPYLYDETQETAKAYKAACTPDFYLFDDEMKCVYRGRLDESRPGSGTKPDGSSLRKAIDQLLAGKKVDEEQFPSIGCNIKWRK